MSRMRELREEKGITQEELAFALDVSQQRVSKVERNQAPLSDDMIIQCAKYFGVTTDYFLGVSDLRLEIEMVDLKKQSSINEARLREFLHYFIQMNTDEQEALVGIEKLIYNLHDKE